MNQTSSSYINQVLPPIQKKLPHYSTKRLIVSLQGCDTQFRKTLSTSTELNLEHPSLFNHWNLFIHEALEFMFDKYQSDPIDWSLRILSALEEQKSFYERLAMAERKSPIVFCPAIKKVADVLHRDPQTLTQFFFAAIESFRQINLPLEDSDWIWYNSYFEGSVIVTVSKENTSWTR